MKHLIYIIRCFFDNFGLLLDDVVNNCTEDDLSFVFDFENDAVQEESEISIEGINELLHTVQYTMPFDELTMDTPDGVYINF